MKKTLLSLVAFVMIIAGANAQTSFGVKAGANLANIGGDGDGDMRIGYHFGGVANLQITDQFALAPELLFSLQGTKYDILDETINMNLSYVNIPVLAKVNVTEGFNLHAGPTVGFLLGAKVKADGDSEDVKDNFKGLDFGVAFGAGYELESGLNFGARYNIGLANIAETEDGDDTKLSNQVINIFVGFNF